MKTREQIEKEMDIAESEIKKILNKYNFTLGMLYDDGVAITINCTQPNENGDYSVFEREAAL